MGSLNVVYHKRNFNIYSVDNNSFIVHNINIKFEEGHTHINSFSTAKYLINMSIHKTIPKHLSNYLLISLLRINTDKEYLENINNMLSLNPKDRKGTSYKDDKLKYYKKERHQKFKDNKRRLA